VNLLVERAEAVRREHGRPLDVIMNYSNMTLQNTTLKATVPRFRAAGVKRILTASPLSMGLLRSAGPRPWHPATQAQKDACIRAREYVEGHGESFADTSMRFLFAKWDEGIVGGWSSVKELEDAVRMWHRVKSGVDRDKDEVLWRGARDAMGDQVDTMWASPEKGWMFKDGTRVE
jgi:D-arabinose 1-dehydrogenase